MKRSSPWQRFGRSLWFAKGSSGSFSRVVQWLGPGTLTPEIRVRVPTLDFMTKKLKPPPDSKENLLYRILEADTLLKLTPKDKDAKKAASDLRSRWKTVRSGVPLTAERRRIVTEFEEIFG